MTTRGCMLVGDVIAVRDELELEEPVTKKPAARRKRRKPAASSSDGTDSDDVPLRRKVKKKVKKKVAEKVAEKEVEKEEKKKKKKKKPKTAGHQPQPVPTSHPVATIHHPEPVATAEPTLMERVTFLDEQIKVLEAKVESTSIEALKAAYVGNLVAALQRRGELVAQL